MQRPYGLAGFASDKLVARQDRGFLPPGAIYGLTLANDTTDATNDISVAAGGCRSSYNMPRGVLSNALADQIDLEVPTAFIKQLDVAYAPASPGSGRSGGRSASAISDTTWHAFLVGGRGVKSDLYLHDSATPATIAGLLPKLGSGYTAFRRIGSILRESAAIVGFVQTGDRFDRKVPVQSYTSSSTGTSAVTQTLHVPIGISVEALLTHDLLNNLINVAAYNLITSLDQTDTAPDSSCHTLRAFSTGAGDADVNGVALRIRTNTSGQIRTRAGTSNAAITWTGITHGWFDRRGQDDGT